jgi:two-component system LytT family response regulator
MSEVTVLLVDDEPLARASLRRLLEPHADIRVVAECKDGLDAVEYLADHQVDLMFLDVQMPELDGFGVIREVGPVMMPRTVFVTAFDEFAVRAFEVHALDYLVKPFSDERFEQMLTHVRAELRYRELIELGEKLSGLLDEAGAREHVSAPTRAASTYAKRLLVTTASRSLVVRTNTIDWVQADDYYAALHCSGKTHLLRETMAALEARLDPDVFLRIHRSAIVNLERVQALERTADGQLMIVLLDGTKLPVSRSRRERVETAFGQAARR